MRAARKQFWIVFLSLAVACLAPLKAISTPINAVPEDPCAVVSACCATMVHCCCEIKPAVPAVPADLGSAASLPAQPKFVSIKGTGRIISQALPRFVFATPTLSPVIQTGFVSVANTVPLYILNRALLI